MATKNFMGINQHGFTYHNLGPYPRKALLDRLDCKKAEPMYVDKKGGGAAQVGYVIEGQWITLYEVTPWEKPA